MDWNTCSPALMCQPSLTISLNSFAFTSCVTTNWNGGKRNEWIINIQYMESCKSSSVSIHSEYLPQQRTLNSTLFSCNFKLWRSAHKFKVLRLSSHIPFVCKTHFRFSFQRESRFAFHHTQSWTSNSCIDPCVRKRSLRGFPNGKSGCDSETRLHSPCKNYTSPGYGFESFEQIIPHMLTVFGWAHLCKIILWFKLNYYYLFTHLLSKSLNMNMNLNIWCIVRHVLAARCCNVLCNIRTFIFSHAVACV